MNRITKINESLAPKVFAEIKALFTGDTTCIYKAFKYELGGNGDIWLLGHTETTYENTWTDADFNSGVACILEARAYCKPPHDSSAISLVRCVSKVDGKWTIVHWTGHCWVQNGCHAKRYKNDRIAKGIATRKGGIVTRFYDDGCGNHPIARA